MGVVRYLCITIVLALACYANAQCGLQGAANLNGVCICQSGYTGSDCNTVYSGSACAASYNPAVHDRDDRFPILDQTLNVMTFRQNTLNLSIVGPVVPNRTYTDIVFLPAAGGNPVNAMCKLSAGAATPSFWTQSMNSGCQDRFALSMPWVNWGACGFAESQDATYFIFRATFVMTYVDSIGRPFNYPDEPATAVMTRRSSVSYKVWVSFLKQIDIDVKTNLITVNNTVNYKVAITRFEYNPANLQLTLGISTGVLFPNMLIRSTVNLTIESTGVTYTLLNNGQPTAAMQTTGPYADQCNVVGVSNCLQYFEYTVSLAAATDCTFDGNYMIQGMVATCRDTPGSCTQALQQANVVVSNSDVCGSVTANPLVTGALESYSDAAMTQATSEFTIGYMGYFEAAMTTVNDFNLTWVDIWVVPDATLPANADLSSTTLPCIQWLYQGGVVMTDGFYDQHCNQYAPGTFTTSPVSLIVNDVTQASNTLPGSSIGSSRVFTPSFNFRFDSRIFTVPFAGSFTTRGFTLHARGHVVYAGNEQYGRKRETKVVDYVFKTDAAEMSSSLPFSLGNEVAAEVSNSEKASTSSVVRSDLLKSLLPVAGIALVVVAAAVVAAVVISKKRSANRFATLAN